MAGARLGKKEGEHYQQEALDVKSPELSLWKGVHEWRKLLPNAILHSFRKVFSVWRAHVPEKLTQNHDC